MSSEPVGNPTLDPDLPDYYATHLAAVDTTNAVVSTEDIYNKRGALVVRKGARINGKTAERILQHKLLKPLEDQVQLEQVVDSSTLKDQFDAMLKRYPDMRQLLVGSNLEYDFSNHVYTTRLPPVLTQNLTVLSHQKPGIFEKALFCAALSYLMARQLGLYRDDVSAAYLAALLHDVGLLRIDPAILDKSGPLEAGEWRAVQSHVVIGQIMLERSPGLPPKTALAVLEHHERCDGSGYPLGKTEEHLDPLGQIVAMSDSLQAIRVNQFEKYNLNLGNAVPFLQMNSTTHFYQVYEAMYSALKKAGINPVQYNVADSISALGTQLMAHGKALTSALPPLEKVHSIIPNMPMGRQGRTVNRLASRVLRMLNTSGLLQEELVHWLKQIQSRGDNEILGELNTIDLMQQELRWQLSSLRRSLNEYLEKELPDNTAASADLRTSLAEINRCLVQLDG